MSKRCTEVYNDHIGQIAKQAQSGDMHAVVTISIISLLLNGWRPGDPDPEDDPNGGGEPIDFSFYRERRAA